MKNLSDKIKDLSAPQIEEIKKILQIKDGKIPAGVIYSHYISYRGMSLIISSLTHEERNILNLVCREKNGVTFSELEKSLKLDTAKIEKHAENLSRKLLVYILKNRQKLSNKLDKIHIVPEIRNTLNPLDVDKIYNYFKEIKKMTHFMTNLVIRKPNLTALGDVLFEIEQEISDILSSKHADATLFYPFKINPPQEK